MPGSELGALHEMKQYGSRCQTRVSDTPLEVSPHNSNMINSNKAVTWHMKISSSRPAHLSKNISSKISDISPCDVHNFYGPTFCLRGYSFANETIWLPTNELAAMITRKTLSANLLFSRFHLASPSPRWEYIIVSAAIVCFSLSLSDK